MNAIFADPWIIRLDLNLRFSHISLLHLMSLDVEIYSYRRLVSIRSCSAGDSVLDEAYEEMRLQCCRNNQDHILFCITKFPR